MWTKCKTEFFLILCLVLALAACGGGGDGSPPTDDTSNWDSMIWDQDNWS